MNVGKKRKDFAKPLFRRKLHLSNEFYCLKRSREKGEMDLLRLAEREYIEGTWYYLEDFGQWYNVTVQALDDFAVVFAELDFDSFGKSLEGLVSHYHIHPKKSYYKYLRDIEKLSKKSNPSCKSRPFLSDYKKKITALLFGLPSLLDMDVFVDLVTSSSKLKQDFRVISHLGKVTVRIYSVEEALMKYRALRKVQLGVIDEVVSMSDSEEDSVRFYVEFLNDLFDEVTFDYSSPGEIRENALRKRFKEKWWRRSRKNE